MNDKQLLTLAQLQAFLNGTVAVDFSVAAEERYDFIARTVCRFYDRKIKFSRLRPKSRRANMNRVFKE